MKNTLYYGDNLDILQKHIKNDSVKTITPNKGQTMIQTILGILIGIATSFIVGIYLLWKGQHLVDYLQRLPTRQRVAIYARSYLIALRGYPYRYANFLAMIFVLLLNITTLLAYIVLTVAAFKGDLSLPPEEFRRSFHFLTNPDFWLIKIVLNPWFLLSVTIFFAYLSRPIVFVTIPSEIMVPFAYRELTRVRECVAKCATNKQFLEYTDAEHSANTLEDLRELIIHAKTILNGVDLKLADEILQVISEDLPKSIDDTPASR